MNGCAFRDCGDPDCRVCALAHIPQEPPVCGQPLGGDVTCELVEGHPTWVACRSSKAAAKTENETRDGSPKLSGERKRKQSGPIKRNRQGPNYVPSHARV